MTALKKQLAGLLGAQGPITVAQYMQAALGDPSHGYYNSRDPITRDFVTAPEISQIFGELIGLFLVQAWEDRGRPERFCLAELGPGRGTLMADIMRAAAKVRSAFAAAAKIVLVEMSPLLRSAQASKLREYAPSWVLRVDALPDDIPLYVVANEFFDALPIRQFVRRHGKWHERMVATDQGELRFMLTPDSQPVPFLPHHLDEAAEEGAVFEIGPSSVSLIEDLARKVVLSNGVGIAIDYGHIESGLGDTLQAVKFGAYADPLSEPGEADLTAHVDFAALGAGARRGGARVSGPVTQATLLETLGIQMRAQRLVRTDPAKALDVDTAVARLIGPAEMGTLFKAMALSAPSSPALPGFPC